MTHIPSPLQPQQEMKIVAWEISAFGTVQVIVRREDVAAERLAQYLQTDPHAACEPLVYARERAAK